MAKILLFGMCLCAFASAHTEAAELSASTESPSTNLLVASPSGQPLNAEEAKQALQRVRLGGQLFHFPGIFPADPKTIPGTWRHLEICDDPDHDSSSTNVTYERRGPNGQLFKREEETSCRTNGNSRTQHRLRLQNEEGLWYVHETIAINCVQPPSVQKVGSPALLESGVWVKLDPSSDFTVRGERFQEAGRGRLRIFQQCSAQTQQRLEKEMKKAIPFLIRPLVSNSFLKQALAQIVPLRLETVMDDESGELMVRRGFASDGRLLYEEDLAQISQPAPMKFPAESSECAPDPLTTPSAWKCSSAVKKEQSAKTRVKQGCNQAVARPAILTLCGLLLHRPRRSTAVIYLARMCS